jgi:hypothetical protein
MITADTVNFEIRHIHSSDYVRAIEAAVATDVSGAEFSTLERITVSDFSTELVPDDKQSKATEIRDGIIPPIEEWTRAREQQFTKLVEKEAIGKLTVDEKAEIERLSFLRRGLKNPRTGEELLWEYEQRKITRNLVEALTQYVHFHQPARSASPA